MIFKPAQLGMAKLDQQELVEDKKSCKKIGPCGSLRLKQGGVVGAAF